MNFTLQEMPEDPLSILYLALRSPHGVLVAAPKGRDEARRQLYSARIAANDVELWGLEIRDSAIVDGDLVIRRKASAPANTGKI